MLDRKTSVHTLWEYTDDTVSAYYEPPDVLLNQYFIQNLLESRFVVKGFHVTEVITCPGNRDCHYLFFYTHNITLNLSSFQAVHTVTLKIIMTWVAGGKKNIKKIKRDHFQTIVGIFPLQKYWVNLAMHLWNLTHPSCSSIKKRFQSVIPFHHQSALFLDVTKAGSNCNKPE